MTLESLLDALFDNADRHDITKENIIVSIYIDNLQVLLFNLELLYRVMPYVTYDFGEKFVKR